MRALFRTGLLTLVTLTVSWAGEFEPAAFKVAGDWQVEVVLPAAGAGGQAVRTVLEVPPAARLTVSGERCERCPVFNPAAGGWAKGASLRGVRAQECATPGLLVPESLEMRAGPGPDSERFEPGKDYDADRLYGTFGRLAEGRIQEGQSVYVSYVCGQLRLDSVVLAADGTVVLRPGTPVSSAPLAPALKAGERLLGNIWLPGFIDRLAAKNLFPVLEPAFPEPVRQGPSAVEKFAPAAFKKLRNGQPLRILAWGDSVTDGGYLPNAAQDRWQAQFAARLRARFPKARIELVSEAWGGRNTDSYMGAAPGSPHSFEEKVLAAQADLIISEFVNDAGFSPEQVEQRYGVLLGEFVAAGTEWIILTPHYVRPDWMGLDRERDIDQDPRPYVKGLREFADRYSVALADASLRYGRLWRQGIPYNALMLNSINHPDARGMKIFADALMELFP